MGDRSGVRIAGRDIGTEFPPYVIAEMSGNHNGSLERALELVEAAARAGAHAVKLQTYTPDTMTLDLAEGDFFISDPDSPWQGTSLYDLYEKAHTPRDWHPPIMARARELGLHCFSSPFDDSAVAYLESLGVPAFKIASFELVDLPLIRAAAATGKPLIMSTGMATLAEIDEAVRTARAAGCEQLVLLKCTSTYPASADNSDILTVRHLREMFGCEVGLSDHTMGIGCPLAAVAHGASVIEKHFTLRRADGGVDADFSLEPDELAALVTESERAWRSLGEVRYGPRGAETKSLVFRRSIYVVEDLEAGAVLTSENIRIIRPGRGLEPRYFDRILGMRVAGPVKRGTPVCWDMLRA